MTIHIDALYSLHPLPIGTVYLTKLVRWRNLEWTACQVDPAAVGRATFQADFDELVQAINAMPGGYAEGDGSFGIVGREGGWKVAGNFFEAERQVGYLQFQGCAPRAVWDELSGALNTDDDQCLVQVAEAGFFTSLGEWKQQVVPRFFPENQQT